MKPNTLLLAGIVFLVGCGGESAKTFDAAARRAAPSTATPPDAPRRPAAGGEAAGAPLNVAPAAPADRKIIYTAWVDLLVESLGAFEPQLTDAIRQYQAIVGHSDVTGSPGTPRSGQWVIRVPAGKFPDFLKEVESLGEVQKTKVDSQDVTEEYFDHKLRIDNKKVQQDRLRTHMKESTGKLTDILEVEKELARVSEEMDRLQGKVRLWDNLAALSTVTINVRERKGYVPPETPAFGTTVSRTFHGSVDALVGFGQGVVLTAVAVAPWLPVIGLVALPTWWLVRRARQRAKAAEAVVVADAPAGAGVLIR
jgi:hypothetical protein